MENLKSKKLTFIVVPTIFVILVIAFSILVRSKINKDTLRKEIQENLSLILENSQVVPGKLETQVGLNIKIGVDGLKILDAITKKTYIEIDKLEINTSWSSLFWAGVPVSFKMSGINVNYKGKFQEVITPRKLLERSAYRKILGFSTFHKNSKFNFELENFSFQGVKQSFNIEHLKLKNFKWDSYTAYEINGKIKKKVLSKTYTVEIRSVGELNLKESINYGKLKSQSILTLRSIKMNDKLMDFEEVNGTLSVSIDEDNLIYGKVSFSADNHFNSGVKFGNNGKVILEDLDANVSFETLYKMGLVDKLPTQSLKNQLTLKGSIFLGPKNIEARKLKFNTLSPVKINMGGIDFFSNFKGSWNKNSAIVGMKGRFSEGQLQAKIRFSKKESIGRLGQFKPQNIEIKLFNIDLRSMTLKKKTFFPALKDILKDKKLNTSLETVKVLIERCSFDSDLLNAKATFEQKMGTFRSDDLSVTFGKNGKLNGQFSINQNKTLGKLEFDKFDIRGISSFLPNAQNDLDGIYNGTIDGIYNFPPSKSRSLNLDLEVSNANFEKFKIIDKVSTFISQIAPDSVTSTKKGKINYVKVKSTLSSSELILEEITLLEANQEYEILGNGRVFILREEGFFPYRGSEIFLKIKNLKGGIWDTSKLPSIIPVKIRANDEGWIPDLMYTINGIKIKR